MDVTESEDPEGLRVFYYLVQDVKVSMIRARHHAFTNRSAVSRVLLDLTSLQDQAHIAGELVILSVVLLLSE
jgi:Mago nashi protein